MTNEELVKKALLSEIESLENSLKIIKNRVEKGGQLGPHPVNTGNLNILIGKYQFLIDLGPPLKPVATIELEFEYGGRSKPIPVTDPWNE